MIGKTHEVVGDGLSGGRLSPRNRPHPRMVDLNWL